MLLELVSADALVVVSLVCLASGLSHLYDMIDLRSDLALQDILPTHLIVLAAWVLSISELVIGSVGSAFFLGFAGQDITLIVATIPGLLLFIVLTIYQLFILHRHGDGAIGCGCGLAASVTTHELAIRTGGLVLMSAVVAIGMRVGWIRSGFIWSDLEFVVLVVTSSICLGALLIWLPIAVQQNRLLEEELL